MLLKKCFLPRVQSDPRPSRSHERDRLVCILCRSVGHQQLSNKGSGATVSLGAVNVGW